MRILKPYLLQKLNIVKKEYNLFQKGSFIADCVTTDIIAKATTNADGQFSMIVPNQKMALFASSSRNVLGDTEDYYWLIWVDKEEKHIMFSNNNTYETQCPTCIVKLTNQTELTTINTNIMNSKRIVWLF